MSAGDRCACCCIENCWIVFLLGVCRCRCHCPAVFRRVSSGLLASADLFREDTDDYECQGSAHVSVCSSSSIPSGVVWLAGEYGVVGFYLDLLSYPCPLFLPVLSELLFAQTFVVVIFDGSCLIFIRCGCCVFLTYSCILGLIIEALSRFHTCRLCARVIDFVYVILGVSA